MKNEFLNLKSRIVEANNSYRIGKPFISDQEFDDLLETF